MDLVYCHAGPAPPSDFVHKMKSYHLTAGDLYTIFSCGKQNVLHEKTTPFMTLWGLNRRDIGDRITVFRGATNFARTLVYYEN